MLSPVAKPPVSHVTAVPANNPFLLNTVHSVQEGKFDQTIGKNIGDLDGTKEGAMTGTPIGTTCMAPREVQRMANQMEPKRV